MLKKVERNDLRMCWILADLQRRVLLIPRLVKETARNLSRPDAALYFEYKNCYPDFNEEII